MLTTRGRLETAIKQFGLYPGTVAEKTMLDAVEEMKPHVGFRSLEGAQYVLSFDGNDPDTVQKVTAYLSDSLIEDYAAGDLGVLRRDSDFLAKEEQGSLTGLEEATRAMTMFLAAHPEFAVEGGGKRALPSGRGRRRGYLSCRSSRETSRPRRTRRWPPSCASAFASTPRSTACRAPPRASRAGRATSAWRKRARRSTSPRSASWKRRASWPRSRTSPRITPTCARRASRPTPPRPPAPAGEDRPWRASSSFEATVPVSATAGGASAGIADRLRLVDAQIAARRAQLAGSAGSVASEKGPKGAGVSAAEAGGSAVAAVVELETEWQRLLRAVGEARARHEDLQARAERATLALEAARVQTNEQMAVVDPPVRPTHPAKSARATAAGATSSRVSSPSPTRAGGSPSTTR